MEALRERLDELRGHFHDQKWLAAHADSLYSVLDSALNSPPQANDAIECLIAICPYMFTRSDFQRWSSLLFDALLNAQLLQDNELQMRVWAQMGEDYLLIGRHQEAQKAFRTALERAREGRTKEMMLEAYIGIIKLQSLHLDNCFDFPFIQAALALARQLGDLAYQAKLHRALALAYAHRGETRASLGHGQTALACWHKLNDKFEMAQAAFTLAVACRAANRLEQGERFLKLAASLFTQTEYALSYCLIAYEEGVLYLHRGEHEIAQQWLMIALEEAVKLDHRHYIAMCHHSLGITLIELKDYGDAEVNLRKALSGWEELKSLFYQANGYHALGYLEAQQGNLTKAHDWLNRGLALCPQIPDMPLRQMTEQLIVDTIAELK